MFLLPESIKKIGLKTTKKSWKHHLRIITLWAYFYKYNSRANFSILCGTIWSKFELLLDVMHVLDTYKFKMDWINTKQEKMETSIFQTLKGN